MPAKKLKSMSTIESDVKNTNFSIEDLVDSLDENGKKELLSNCHMIFTNSSFKKICDELKSAYIIQNAIEKCDLDDHAYYRGVIHGVEQLYEVISNHSQEYLASIKKEEEFDPQAVI